MLQIKRIYEVPKEDDGYRILVDRIWPPGLAKTKAKMDTWLKELGPSNGLKKWFNHDPAKWEDFKTRYFDELRDKDEMINIIIEKSKDTNVTLLYGSADTNHNGAIVLKEFLDAKISPISDKEIKEEKGKEDKGEEEEKDEDENVEKDEEEKDEDEKVEKDEEEKDEDENVEK